MLCRRTRQREGMACILPKGALIYRAGVLAKLGTTSSCCTGTSFVACSTAVDFTCARVDRTLVGSSFGSVQWRQFATARPNANKHQRSNKPHQKGSSDRGPSQRQGGKAPPKEKAAEPALDLPPHNDALLAYKEVRVISDTNENLGVMPTQQAILAARSRKLDLVLASSVASPPVCRMTDYQALVHAKKETAKAAAEASKAKKTKEIRLTARTDEHDLAVKAGKVIDFLRDAHPVRVSVSFTLSAWAKEEPARREIMAKLVRRVAEAGAGFADSSSIAGAGTSLQALFQPTSSPKAAADWAKTLARLTTPIRPAAAEEGNKIASPEHIGATVAAALDGQVKATTAATILPPDEVLRKYAAAKAKVHRGVKAGEVLNKGDFDDRGGGGPGRARGGIAGGEDEDEEGGGGGLDKPMTVGRTRRGKAARAR